MKKLLLGTLLLTSAAGIQSAAGGRLQDWIKAEKISDALGQILRNYKPTSLAHPGILTKVKEIIANELKEGRADLAIRRINSIIKEERPYIENSENGRALIDMLKKAALGQSPY